MTNRVGTSTLHEHGDNRIHVEGVLTELYYGDVHSFFEVVGGEINENSFSIPTNYGLIQSGGCNGTLQIFVYKVIDQNSKPWEYIQKKVSPEYILSPQSNVPPGDCIVIEYGTEKKKTDRICESYEIAIQKGKLVEQKLERQGSEAQR